MRDGDSQEGQDPPSSAERCRTVPRADRQAGRRIADRRLEMVEGRWPDPLRPVGLCEGDEIRVLLDDRVGRDLGADHGGFDLPQLAIVPDEDRQRPAQLDRRGELVTVWPAPPGHAPPAAPAMDEPTLGASLRSTPRFGAKAVLVPPNMTRPLEVTLSSVYVVP